MLDLGPGRGGGAPARRRPRRPRLQARDAPRGRRRQPAAALLGATGHAGAGRHSGAVLPGRAGAGDGLRLPERRDRDRDRRGPGAGRQALRDPAAVPEAEAHLLRRPARIPALPARGARLLRVPARRGRALGEGPPGLPRGVGGAGARRRHGDHALHLGHDRQSQGRRALLRQPDSHQPGLCRARGLARRRGSPRLPSHGLDRPEPVFLRAVAGDGVPDQLPGIGRDGHHRHARDRPHLLLRPAARAGGPAHAGDHPDGGRGRRQALALPPLHGGRAARGLANPGRPNRVHRRPAQLLARRAVHLRAASQFPRHVAHPRGLHRGRGHRTRSVRLLPLARHQPEADLRADRDLRHGLRPAQRPGETRHRRPAHEGRRDPAHGQRRDRAAQPRALRRVPPERGGHARGQGRARAGTTREMPATSTPTGT